MQAQVAVPGLSEGRGTCSAGMEPGSGPATERMSHRPSPPALARPVRFLEQYVLPEEQRRCSCCDDVMQPSGEEVTEQREFIPASLFVIQHAQA